MTKGSVRKLLWRRAKSDWGIVLIAMTLLALGLVMILSTSKDLPYLGLEKVGAPDTFFRSQLRYAAMGLVGMFIVSRIDYHLYRRYVLVIGIGTLVALIAMASQQTRFLTTAEAEVGRTGSGQLTEVAKYGVIIYLAAWLSSAGPRLKQFREGLLPAATILAVSCGLVVLQQNLSAAVLLGVTCLIMMFVAGMDWRQLAALLVVGVIVTAALALLISYREERVEIFFSNPLTDAWNKGYQTVRSIIALNNGRLFGLGLAHGIENRNLHLMAHTDFMFAMIGEQLGFVGSLLTLGLYAVYTWRGYGVALRAVDSFGRLLATGLVSWEVCRAVLHVAVVTNTVPVTGTVLPYMSYGGSALVSGLAALGILVNISRRATIEAETPR